MLIDSHCHLSELSEEELGEVLAAAKANQVEALVAIGAGYGFDDNLKTLEIAKKHDNIFCALAMHPHDAKEVTGENFAVLKNIIETEPKVKAVGEIGLDYHYMHSDKTKQQEVLRQFIKLALEVKKPIVIHDRDCGDDCINILKEESAEKVGGMVHCFTGTMDLAKKYLDFGFIVSFTGIITFKKADDLREIVKMVPLEQMTIETDSPFLTPMPFRGKKNQPAYVKHVAECVAEIKGVSFEEVAEKTTANAKRFFGIA
jgi:TatD DNase family protein